MNKNCVVYHTKHTHKKMSHVFALHPVNKNVQDLLADASNPENEKVQKLLACAAAVASDATSADGTTTANEFSLEEEIRAILKYAPKSRDLIIETESIIEKLEVEHHELEEKLKQLVLSKPYGQEMDDESRSVCSVYEKRIIDIETLLALKYQLTDRAENWRLYYMGNRYAQICKLCK